jgi:hypothetical protein
MFVTKLQNALHKVHKIHSSVFCSSLIHYNKHVMALSALYQISLVHVSDAQLKKKSSGLDVDTLQAEDGQ